MLSSKRDLQAEQMLTSNNGTWGSGPPTSVRANPPGRNASDNEDIQTSSVALPRNLSSRAASIPSLLGISDSVTLPPRTDANSMRDVRATGAHTTTVPQTLDNLETQIDDCFIL
jgi:hypothetical protein